MFDVDPGGRRVNLKRAARPATRDGLTCELQQGAGVVLYTSLPESRTVPDFTGFSRILCPSIVLLLYMY
jgi:hypothetical protein